MKQGLQLGLCFTDGEAGVQESDVNPNDTLLVIGGTPNEMHPTPLSCLQVVKGGDHPLHPEGATQGQGFCLTVGQPFTVGITPPFMQSKGNASYLVQKLPTVSHKLSSVCLCLILLA